MTPDTWEILVGKVQWFFLTKIVYLCHTIKSYIWWNYAKGNLNVYQMEDNIDFLILIQVNSVLIQYRCYCGSFSLNCVSPNLTSLCSAQHVDAVRDPSWVSFTGSLWENCWARIDQHQISFGFEIVQGWSCIGSGLISFINYLATINDILCHCGWKYW